MSDLWNTSEDYDSQPGDRSGQPEGEQIPVLPSIPDLPETPAQPVLPPPIPAEYQPNDVPVPLYTKPQTGTGHADHPGRRSTRRKKKKNPISLIGLIVLLYLLFQFGLPVIGLLLVKISEDGTEGGFSTVSAESEQRAELIREANRYLDEKAYKKAMDTADQVLLYGQGNPKALVIKGDALRLMNREMEAQYVYRRALLTATGGTKALAQYGLAAALIDAPENTDYEEAEALLKQAPQSGLLREENFFSLSAKLYYFKGNHQKALRLMQQALDLNAKHHVTLHYRGMLLEEEGQYHDALKDLNLALALDENGYTRLTRGKVYYHLSDYEKAIDDLEKATTMIPDNAEAYHFLTYIHEDRQDYGKAVITLKQALKIEPEDRSHQIYLANLLNKNGEARAAVKHLNTLEARYADYDDYYWERSLIMADQGDFYEAIRAMESYVALINNYEDRLHALEELQDLYLEVKQYEALLYTLQRIEENRNLRPVEWVWRTQAHHLLGDKQRMMRSFELGLEMHPGNLLLSKWYADALYQNKRLEEALLLVDELGKLWPEDEWSFYQKAMMLACYQDRTQRDGGAAAIALKKAGRLVPEKQRSSWYWSIHAAVYAENGDFEKAVEAQTRAIFQAEDHEILEYEAEMRWYQNQEPYGGLLEPKPEDGPTNSGGNEA